MLDLEKLRKSGGEDQKSKTGTNLRKTVSYEQLDNTVQPEIDVNRRNSTKSKIKLKRSTSQRSSLVVFDQLKKITKDLAKGFSLHSNSSRTSIKSERTRDTENEQGLSNIHDRTEPGTVEKAKKKLVGLNASAVKNSSNGGLDENEIEDLVKLAPIKLSTVGGDRLRFKIGEVDSALFGTFGNSGSMVGNSSRGEYGYVGSEDFSNINININVNSNINSNSSIDGEENSLSKPIANIDNRLNSVHDSFSVEKSTSPFSNQYMTSKQLIQQYTQNIRPRVIESMTKQNEDDSLWMEDDQSVKSYDPSKEVGGQADNYSTNNKSISVNNNSNSIGNISFNISIENVDSVNSSRENEHFMTVRGSPLKENHRLNENVDNFKAFTDKNMDEFEYHKEKEKLDKLRLDILKRNISNYSEENISVVTTESLESLETQSDSSKGSVHLHRTIKLDKFPVRLIVPAENIYIKPELKMANDSQNQPNRRSIVLTTIKDQFTKPTNSDTNRNERLIENTTINVNVNVNADSDNAYKTQRVDKRLDNIELKKFSTGSFLIEGFTSENDNNQYNEANKKTTQNQNQTQNQSESVYHNDIDKINASVDMEPKELLDTDHSVSGNGIINVVDYVINREFGREGESKVEKEREIQVESGIYEEEEEEYYSAKSLLFEDGEIVDFPVNDTILNNTQADDNNNGSKESMGNQNDDSDLYTSSSMTTISSLSSLTESNGNTSVVGNQHSSDNIHNILKRYSSSGKDPNHMQNIRKSIISNNLELLSSAHVNHSKQRPSSVVLYNHDNSNKVSFSKEYLFNNKTVHDLETRERLDQYKYRLSLAGLEECWTTKQSEILDHSEERRPNNKKIRQKRSGGKENVEVDIEINESRDKEGHEQVVDEMYKRMNHKDNEYSDQANLIKQHLMLSSSFDFKDKKDPADFIDSGEVEYKHNSNVAGLNHHNNIEVYNENAENERTSMINQYYEYSQFYETGGINSYNQDNTNDSNGDKKNNYNTQSTVFSRAESMNKRAADKSIAKNKTNNNIDTNTNTNTNANAIAIANANTNSYRLDINALDAKYNQNNFANNRAPKSLNNDSNIVSKMKKFAPENKGRNRSGNRVKSFISAKDLVDSNKNCRRTATVIVACSEEMLSTTPE
ncbi:hypothetical protein AX774_g6285 [Zancudomyces culisetae]|uniref:Uncharacterized protein n=1 Tax=Zancudomyces culisetae TaxID=1213189 RepID=A0A1R1PH32_ZANCU|nr:hypothetical protein AX774_g6285 [Zancudomyces culisetae]|eukprot:OMH80284.1 hypothetical protein AX774_g6285 [Zancudomyces culisetae]